MGLPTSYKRARRSPSPESFQSPDMAEYGDWSPLANSKTSTPAAAPPPQETSNLRSPRGNAWQGKSPMEQLGEPLLVRILQLSQPTAWDLCRMSCVSRAWRRACAHRSFWTRLRVGSGSLRSGVEQLAPRCTELVELFVDDPRCELHILHPIIIACAQSLRRVVIDCDRDASSRNEASISSVLWLISLYCKGVESIELQSNGQDATMGSLEGRTMWYLTSAFRNIRYFACLAKGSLTKQCVYLMAIAWRDLECVRVNMEGLNVEDLLALRKCCSLRALELVGGSLAPLGVGGSLAALSGGGGLNGGGGLSGGGSATPLDATSTSREANVARQQLMPVGRVSSSTHTGGAEEAVLDGYGHTMGSHGLHPTAEMRGALFGSGSPIAEALRHSAMGAIFHPTLELLVLNRVEFDAETVASLAVCCPSLKRILVSGALCESCLVRDGPCVGSTDDCVRKRVDMIQVTLHQVRVSLHQ